MKRTLLITAVTALLFLGQSPLAWAQVPDDDWDDDFDMAFEQDDASTLNPINGFLELAYSRRLQTDLALDQPQTLADARVQFQWEHDFENTQFKTRTDLYYDAVKHNTQVQVREFSWQGSLSDVEWLSQLFGKSVGSESKHGLNDWGEHFDFKIGQQVLTWGTGDYLFLNDLFPKDYQSFFSGRDDEYLKAPSFALKLSGYFNWVNLDFVVTPRFTPDNFINGEYYSFFNPQFPQRNVAPEFHVASHNKPTNPEYHLRLHKSVGVNEIAAYGYKGHSPLPDSTDENGLPRFSDINVYGFSWIRPVANGLFKVEYAYQNALEDLSGVNPNVPNSVEKYLIGYEKELYANLTGSVQWYTERTQDHDALLAHSPWPQFEQEKVRNVITTQLIYRAMQQTLTLNWFTFYSPTDDDGYTRFRATYSPVDEWQISAGFNGFYGDKRHTFFAQFKDASNAFVSFRYFYSS